MALMDELLVGLGFQYDPKEMGQFKEDVSKTTDVIKSLTKIAIAGATAITGLVVSSTAASDSQGKLASEIGETVEEVDALQHALTISGGSADGMSNSLRALSIKAAEAARGVGSGVEAFGLLGINATDANGEIKQSSQLMSEISGEFQSLSKSKQIELADKLGIKDSVLLLQQGPKAIRELTNEAKSLGVTTGEDAVIAAEFQDSLTRVWRVVKQVSRSLTRELAPIVQSVTDGFVDWWKTNRQIIEQNLPEWIDKATMAFKLLLVATGAWLTLRIVGHLTALITLFKGLSIAALTASATAALLPALIGAGIAALALLAEDAKVFFAGGESFIGDMIEKFPQWTGEIRTVAAIFATMADLTTMIFDGWSKIIDMFSNLSLEGLKDFTSNLPGFLGEITGVTDKKNEIMGDVSEIGDSIMGNIKGVFGDISMGGLLESISPVPNFNFPNTVGNSSSSTKVDKMEIVVQGGADSAENIANAVMNVFQQASQDLNTAVDQ